LQVAPAALEQPAGEVILKGADMPADRTLGDRQLFGRPGERAVPGGRLKGAQGIERGKATGHAGTPERDRPSYQKALCMSFNHASNRFYPFVQWPASAENQRSPGLSPDRA